MYGFGFGRVHCVEHTDGHGFGSVGGPLIVVHKLCLTGIFSRDRSNGWLTQIEPEFSFYRLSNASCNRSLTPKSLAILCRYLPSIRSSCTFSTPKMSCHWRSETSPPRRYHSNLAKTTSSGVVTYACRSGALLTCCSCLRLSWAWSKVRCLATKISTLNMVPR